MSSTANKASPFSGDKSLETYLNEISEVPMLSSEEEVALAKRIKEGDDQALARLVNGNLRFVVSIAKEYQNQGLALGDLINEGNIGLIKAAARFDETRGFKFISYAVWWIRQSILQSLAENARVVRLPLNRVGTLNKISKIYAKLEQQYEREPSASEIATALELAPKDIRDAFRFGGRQVSLDAPVKEGEVSSLGEMIETEEVDRPDRELLSESLSIEVERALATLTERESAVLKLYFGIGYDRPFTLEEIGDHFSLTRERVRQIKEKAIARLRHQTRSRLLRQFLG
jgi:RNA polymerase primary sigma factor